MKTARGFAAISAIVVLVILAALGAFMVTLSGTQQITAAQDVMGSRAYRAARAGMEWIVSRLAGGGTPLTACPAGSPYTLDDGDGAAPADLDDFTVTVTCASVAHDEGGTTRTIFWVTSTASVGGAAGGIGYAERALNAFVEF